MEFNVDINLLEGAKIYGQFERVGEGPISQKTLDGLNTKYPGIVFQGNYGLSCKLFLKNSTTAFVPFGVDTRSNVCDQQHFDVTKVRVAFYKKAGTAAPIPKIYITDDALMN